MKWQAKRPYWQTIQEWHSRFSWRPRLIPEQRADSIVVPAHWIWLERYESRWEPRDDKYERRSYTGRPSLRKLRRQ